MSERWRLVLIDYPISNYFTVFDDCGLVLLHLLPSEVEGQASENLLQIVFSVKLYDSEVVDEDEIVCTSSVRSIVLFKLIVVVNIFSFIGVASGGKTGRRCKTNTRAFLTRIEIDKIVRAGEDLLRADYAASSNVVRTRVGLTRLKIVSHSSTGALRIIVKVLYFVCILFIVDQTHNLAFCGNFLNKLKS